MRLHAGPATRSAATLACMVAVAWTSAQAGSDADLATLVDAAVEAKTAQALPSCASSAPNGRSGLTIRDGIVTSADLIEEIGGYARAAGTTGGLGGRLLVVSTVGDYDPEAREPAIPGSLRGRLEQVAREKTPAWIVFDPALGPGARIGLKNILRVPSNVTIDGSCADITLEAPNDSRTILAYVASGVSNVVIARVAMRKIGYVPEQHPHSGSAIVINGDFDRVAILHNDLSECGHSCIDITISPYKPVPALARITVAYNYVRDHDKVLLFGTFDCPLVNGLNQCDGAYFESNRRSLAGLHLTLEGNLFLRTGQRHPRVFGRATAHVFNNMVAFQPLTHANGSPGLTYGVFVSNGARALVEDNVFLPLGVQRAPPLAVWTVKSPEALPMPTDTEGFVRLGPNALLAGVLASEDQPAEVRQPEYPYTTIPLAGLSLKAALACLAGRAGRAGSPAWDKTLCSP